MAALSDFTALIGVAIVEFGAESFGKVVVAAGILAGLVVLGCQFILMVIRFIPSDIYP